MYHRLFRERAIEQPTVRCYQFQDLSFRVAVVAMITFAPNEIGEPTLKLSLTASKYNVFICT
jgi:hypothetical protein